MPKRKPAPPDTPAPAPAPGETFTKDDGLFINTFRKMTCAQAVEAMDAGNSVARWTELLSTWPDVARAKALGACIGQRGENVSKRLQKILMHLENVGPGFETYSAFQAGQAYAELLILLGSPKVKQAQGAATGRAKAAERRRENKDALRQTVLEKAAYFMDRHPDWKQKDVAEKVAKHLEATGKKTPCNRTLETFLRPLFQDKKKKR